MPTFLTVNNFQSPVSRNRIPGRRVVVLKLQKALELRPREIQVFITKSGRKPFREWLWSLSDDFRSIVRNRLDRVERGNFGDTKSLGDGVHELRIDVGSGYRVYYGLDGKSIVLLLCGGDKKRQVKDIEQAKRYWNEYKENKETSSSSEL